MRFLFGIHKNKIIISHFILIIYLHYKFTIDFDSILRNLLINWTNQIKILPSGNVVYWLLEPSVLHHALVFLPALWMSVHSINSSVRFFFLLWSQTYQINLLLRICVIELFSICGKDEEFSRNTAKVDILNRISERDITEK